MFALLEGNFRWVVKFEGGGNVGKVAFYFSFAREKLTLWSKGLLLMSIQ